MSAHDKSPKAEMRPKSEKWLVAPGAYHVLASGAQPPHYLMLHANGFNGGAYVPLLERLPGNHGWAAPDFRGHGHSFQPLRISSWFEFVADVLAWEDAGKIGHPIAVGHSLGGIVALLTEAMRPGTFRGIVLLDPIAFLPRFVTALAMAQLPGLRRLHPMVRLTRKRRMNFPDREAVIRAYSGKAAFRAWEPAFLRSYVEWGTLNIPNSAPGDVPSGVRLACDRRTEAQIFSTWPLTFWKMVARVNCPVLILRGADSQAFAHKAAVHLQARLPNAVLKEIPRAGHFLPMEQPDQVLEAIAGWENDLNAGRLDVPNTPTPSATLPDPTRHTAKEVPHEDQ